jgi:hypothetical protein
MSSYFIKTGNQYTLTSRNNVEISDELPNLTFSVNFNVQTGQYYLEIIEDLEFNGKRYGDLDPKSDRVISTFLDREQNTGVLLNGEKGSGKTLLAKVVSQKLREKHSIPTLVVNTAFHGEGFNSFIAGISQPCAIIFDEFEKVYASGQKQEDLLTLFDGTRGAKKLFIVTANDGGNISSYMYNRPGRLYYMFDYRGLTEDFIKEYCNDHLKSLDKIPEICFFANNFSAFNFDMLKALIEELNRYGEGVEAAVNYLNIKPTGSSDGFKVEWSSLEDDPRFKAYEWRTITGVNPYQDTFNMQLMNKDQSVKDLVKGSIVSKADMPNRVVVNVYDYDEKVINIDGSIEGTSFAYLHNNDIEVKYKLVPLKKELKKYSRMTDFGGGSDW